MHIGFVRCCGLKLQVGLKTSPELQGQECICMVWDWDLWVWVGALGCLGLLAMQVGLSMLGSCMTAAPYAGT